MDKNYEKRYHYLEESNWWFKARGDIIIYLLRDYPKDIKILEIGCSGGVLLKRLKELGFKNLYGLDISKDAVKICKERGIRHAFLRDAVNTKFKNNYFDIVIASDVIEHIKDDYKVLSELRRILKDSGKILVFVPAFSFLYSFHDKMNHHFRRYDKSVFKRLVSKSGFKIDRISYWNFILFFPDMLSHFFPVKKNTDNLYELNSFTNGLLYKLLSFENFLLRYINFPVGVSIFAVIKKAYK